MTVARRGRTGERCDSPEEMIGRNRNEGIPDPVGDVNGDICHLNSHGHTIAGSAIERARGAICRPLTRHASPAWAVCVPVARAESHWRRMTAVYSRHMLARWRATIE